MRNRRDFLKSGMAFAGTAALGLGARAASVGKKKIPVGIQLFSFRDQAKDGFDGIIKKAAELGYAGVEFAGYGPYWGKAPDLKKLLDDCGLKAFGTHTGYGEFFGDKLQRTMDFHLGIGCKYMIIPGMGDEQLGTKDACLKTAETLTGVSEKAQQAGLFIGYHAHGGDFKKVDGNLTAWEVLFDNTPKAFIHQIDIGNAFDNNDPERPFRMIERYPGRSLSVHLKEHGGPQGAVFGEGKMDFRKAIDLSERVGGTTCFIVEHESNPAEAYPCAKKCLDYLKAL
ncbi:MAG: sugar phosphate isomerase/epimerase [Kiritimatiellaeota bacterium]|nr:sugar phosphate isomerase/epimerase [Kiritimatiellota bacterium]